MNTIGKTKLALRGWSQFMSDGQVVRALVQRRNYGADIRLSDGRTGSLWAYAVSGCVMEAAVSWAKRNGAVHVTVHG